jgi:Ca2+-binding RTX toxin-like protein
VTVTAVQAIAVTVTNVNEAPTITSAAFAAVAENQLFAATVVASDVESATLSYSLSGGADAALFTIDAASGALSFLAAPNYEAPADADANNIYDVVVSASDGSLATVQAVAVSVDNVNEALSITSTAVALVGENTTDALVVTARDLDGDAVAYAIAGGADAALFTIDAVTGMLDFVGAPNFEAPADADMNNVYDVTVAATDGSFTQLQALAITVSNVNEGLAITSASLFAVAENATAVTNIVAIDQDGGPVGFAIVGGADAALFAIDAATGALRFVAGPDFENPNDAGADHIYDVIVSATDGSFADTKSLLVTVTNVNEAVTITSAASAAVAENGTAVLSVTATDLDGDAISYAITGGADAARFIIDAATGALRFASAPDFEAPGDAGANNVYDVVVSASDGNLVDSRAMAVTVANINEGVTITSGSSYTLLENSRLAGVVAAADLDGDALVYSIVGGVDAARFTIDAASGQLNFVSAPNFEAPADAGANNVYDVIVRASDGTLSDARALAITVTNVNEGPVLTSFGGAATAAASVAENTLVAGRVSATDPEGFADLRYAIVGGADADRFTVNPWNGQLVFNANPNYEIADDAGGNRVYDVVVSVTDAVSTVTQTLAISLTNIVTESTLTGTSAANTINGTASPDAIYGLAGNDTLSGLAGNDILDGGAGNDTLVGGAGMDQLLGGLGADIFRFGLTTESTVAAPDFVADFTRAQGDKISVNPIDANTTLAGNQNFTFIGAAAFHNVAGELRYEIANGYTNVSGGVNGDGTPDFLIQFNGQIDLVATDFVL